MEPLNKVAVVAHDGERRQKSETIFLHPSSKHLFWEKIDAFDPEISMERNSNKEWTIKLSS